MFGGETISQSIPDSLVEMQIIMSLYDLKVKQLRKASVIHWIRKKKKTIARMIPIVKSLFVF